MGRDKWLGGELGSDGNVYGIPGAVVADSDGWVFWRRPIPSPKKFTCKGQVGMEDKICQILFGILRFFKNQ